MFKRAWFAEKMIEVDEVPKGTRWVRHWDLAATKRKATVKKKAAKKPAAKKAAKKPAAKPAAKPVAKAAAAPAAPAAQTTLNPQAAWPFPTASKP